MNRYIFFFATICCFVIKQVIASNELGGRILNNHCKPEPGTVTPANSKINAYGLDTINQKIYVAGSFKTYDGLVRHSLARINANTGVIESSWAPKCSGEVSDILVSFNKIYIIGNLDTIAGVADRYAACIDTAGNFVWTKGNNDNDVNNGGINNLLNNPINNNDGKPLLSIYNNQLVAFNFSVDSFINSGFNYLTLVYQNKATVFNINTGAIITNNSFAVAFNNLWNTSYTLSPSYSSFVLENLTPDGSDYYFSIRSVNYNNDSIQKICSFNGSIISTSPTLPTTPIATPNIVSIDINGGLLRAFYARNYDNGIDTNALVVYAKTNLPAGPTPLSYTLYKYKYKIPVTTFYPIDPVDGSSQPYVVPLSPPTKIVVRDKRMGNRYIYGNARGVLKLTPPNYNPPIENFLGTLSKTINIYNDTLSQFTDSSLYNIKCYNPKQLRIHRNKLFTISTWHHGAYFTDYITSHCLNTETPSLKNITLPIPLIGQLPTWSICLNSINKLILKKRNYVSNTNYIYTGTGVTFNTNSIGNGDSVEVLVSLNATPGILKIIQKSDCNRWSDTLQFNVAFKPQPNLTAGANENYTCIKHSAILTATTSNTSYTTAWFNASNVLLATNTLSLSVNESIESTGNFIIELTNTVNGCKITDTVNVSIDTIKPQVTFPTTNNYTLTCKHPTQFILANAINTNDTVYWFGGSHSLSNSTLSVSSIGKNYVYCKSTTNGCVGTDSVIIFVNMLLPSVSNNVTKDSVTCIRDSVFLNGTTTIGNVLYWQRPGFTSDSVANPIYSKLIGYHSLIAHDTITGCKSTLLINVSNSKLAPYVSVPSHTAIITCSQSSITLTGSSATPSTTIQWQGPSSFSASNPAIISSIGVYTITVTDQTNGCTKSDSVKVTKQSSLTLNATPNTYICYGSSVTLTATPIGGTLPYTYNWQSLGAMPQQTVQPLSTTIYTVSISDALGCAGTKTIIVNVPFPLLDSTLAYQPCDPNNPNGQIQVFAKGGYSPYQFNINGGGYQSSGVFSNLSFGTYTISIRDTLGCKRFNTIDINNTSLAPHSDFIVSTHLFKTDTFVVVDISNPKPDTVIWNFPTTFTVINNSNPYSPIVMCSDTGYYNISQIAHYGSCQTAFNKTVHISYNDGSFATSYNNNGINNITLSPNPNNGQFGLNVSLFKKQTFAIFVHDALGVEKLRITVNDSDNYSGNVSVPQVTNGTYLLKVISAYDSRTIVFIVNQ
jgi:hypothetical protein